MNDWDTPIRNLAEIPSGMPEAPTMTQDAGALLKLADKLDQRFKMGQPTLRNEEVPIIIVALRQAASQGSAGGERSAVQSAIEQATNFDAQNLEYARDLLADLDDDYPDNETIVAQRFRKVRTETILAAGSAPAAQASWMLIETAPKDGNPILLLSKEHADPADINGGPYHHPARCAIGRWHAEGTSWCDEHGRFPDDPEVDDDTINLHVTGVWFSGGGWFQPNEITHWMPLPGPVVPSADKTGAA